MLVFQYAGFGPHLNTFSSGLFVASNEKHYHQPHLSWVITHLTQTKRARGSEVSFPSWLQPRLKSIMISNDTHAQPSERTDSESWRPMYVPIEDVEPLERYTFGGYHPASIGELLVNRYQIVQNLGYGTYSTTRLAKDRSSRT